MTGAETIKQIAAHRRTRCAEIELAAERFKICEGCSSIAFLDANQCPHCHAYRFDTDPEAVRKMAALLGTRPLAEGCPVLPRFF